MCTAEFFQSDYMVSAFNRFTKAFSPAHAKKGKARTRSSDKIPFDAFTAEVQELPRCVRWQLRREECGQFDLVPRGLAP